MKFTRKMLAAILCVLLLGTQTIYAAPIGSYILAEEEVETTEEETENAEEGTKDALALSAESAVLMEASTGQILYEKEAHKQLPPASVTKVMTMLLIFDALEEGKIKLEDEVTTSEYAASMGGSQVFLEPGEVQTVDTMLKCIAVASANDACVAMAEYVSGSEETFVEQMNARAKGLGMKETTFKNCNGLDIDGHVTTAYDIALMSRELITKYPKVHDYSTIWMENITHTTRKGTSEFGLSNTNKFLRQYEYATGLKTGSTSLAKFCLSATAKKNDIELIAGIMAAPDSKQRVKDAIALMNYGFGKCQRYEDTEVLPKEVKVPVTAGKEKEVTGVTGSGFRYVDMSGADLTSVEKKISLKESLKAPVKKGDVIGVVTYTLNGQTIGQVEIKAVSNVGKMKYPDALEEMLGQFVL